MSSIAMVDETVVMEVVLALHVAVQLGLRVQPSVDGLAIELLELDASH